MKYRAQVTISHIKMTTEEEVSAWLAGLHLLLAQLALYEESLNLLTQTPAPENEELTRKETHERNSELHP